MKKLSERIYLEFSAEGSSFTDIDTLRDKLDSYKPFSDNEKAGLASYEEDFLVRFVHGSNAIEGSTLTLIDTVLALEGEFVPDKPGREIFAARGSADGFAYYRKALAENRDFNPSLIQDIHERTALDSQPAVRGVLRQHPVYIRGSQTVPASWDEVRFLLSDLFTAEEKSLLHPIKKIAAFHVLFEEIHPFSDGNGRTGRLVLNYMLEKVGYPPIAIKGESRGKYLSALEDWQIGQDKAAFTDLVISCIHSELEARIACIESTRFPG